MASSETHQTVASDHGADGHNEKKISEETETNKQQNVPPHKADGKEDEKEKPTSDNKKSEVPVIAEIEKVNKSPSTDEINVKNDGNSESLPKEKTEAVVHEQKSAVATVVQEKKPSVENVKEGKPEAVEPAEKLPEKKTADLNEVGKGSPVSGVVQNVDDGKNRDETPVKGDKSEESIPSVEKSLEGEQGGVNEKKSDLPSAVETKSDNKDGAEAAEKADVKAEADEGMKKEEGVDDKNSEGDETKTSKEVPAETPQRSSSLSILSKVKQSFGKMKKAIAGKYPSSKNLQAEDKGEEKAN